jgi:hypothetical protein
VVQSSGSATEYYNAGLVSQSGPGASYFTISGCCAPLHCLLLRCLAILFAHPPWEASQNKKHATVFSPYVPTTSESLSKTRHTISIGETMYRRNLILFPAKRNYFPHDVGNRSSGQRFASSLRVLSLFSLLIISISFIALALLHSPPQFHHHTDMTTRQDRSSTTPSDLYGLGIRIGTSLQIFGTILSVRSFPLKRGIRYRHKVISNIHYNGITVILDSSCTSSGN